MYILYSSFLLIISLLSIKTNKRATHFFIAVYFLLSVFVFGLRYGVGIDYFSYEFYFYNRAETFSSEPLYSLVNWLFYTAGFEFYSVTIFIYAIIFICFLAGAYRFGLTGKYLWLATLLFTSNAMLLYLNGMRQGAAAAICFAGMIYLFKKSYFRYALMIFLGIMFHYSAVIFALFPFFLRFLVSKRTVFFVLLLVPLSFVSAFTVKYGAIFERIVLFTGAYDQHTFANAIATTGFPLGVFLRVSFCSFLLFWLLIGKVRFSKELFFAANMYGLGVMFNAISVQNFMFGRVGYLFYLFEALAISLIVLRTKDKKEKSVLFLITIMYALVFTLYTLTLFPEINGLEYQSIFSKP